MDGSSRRKKVARRLASATVVALFIGACGSNDAADTDVSTESVAPGASREDTSAVDTSEGETSIAPETTTSGDPDVDPGATLTVAITNPLQTLDPHGGASPSTGTMPFIEPVYDRLVALGPDMTLEPMLATDWSFSNDGLTFTMNLRSDAVFSDGTPLTAEAVKLSIERLKSFEGAREAGEIASVETVEAIDDSTVAFNLIAPDAALPYTLASAVGMVISANAIDNADLGENPVGIGPYVVSEFVAGAKVTYERNPDYWNNRVQNFAQIEISAIPDDNARLNGLRSGEFDVIYVSPSQVAEMESLAESGDFGLHRAPAWGYEHMWLNLDRVPDFEVRKAMIQAIDREAIADQLFGGDCVVTTQPQGEGMIGHDPALDELYPYDPEAAASVIAALPEAPRLTMAAIPSSPNQEMAVVIRQQLEQVGFDLEITQGDAAAQFGSFALGEVDGIPAISASAPFFQGQILTPTFMALSKAADHASGELLALSSTVGDSTMTEEERAQVIGDINRLYAEELVGIPLCRTGIKHGYSADVIGVEYMRFPISRRVPDVRHLSKLAG